jgi:hypothetical protein
MPGLVPGIAPMPISTITAPNTMVAPAAIINRARLAPLRVRALPNNRSAAVSSPIRKPDTASRSSAGDSGRSARNTGTATATYRARTERSSQTGTARRRPASRTVRYGWASSAVNVTAPITVGRGPPSPRTMSKRASTVHGVKTSMTSR